MKDAGKMRIDAIIELLKKHKISDQNQLVALLKEHYAIRTNQAAVSRDLRKLRVIKTEIDGELIYDLPSQDVTDEILKLAIVDISHNQSMIVIKTQPALADFVGDQIDSYSDLPLLGCLSGENMVFVAPINTSLIHKTYKMLCERLKFKTKEQNV